MESLETYRKRCLRQQTELRQIMTGGRQPEQARELFLLQHAMLHSARVSQGEGDTGAPWSYEDALLDDMSAAQLRRLPRGCEHSVAWLVWHVARCEDITMNLLVAGSPQVLHEGGWLAALHIPFQDTGNAMTAAEAAAFNATIDPQAVRGYRQAVGRRTRQIARRLRPDDLPRKVRPDHIQLVWAEGAVLPAAHAIVDYWAGRTVAGLLLMPATRHNLVHLNEALEVKQKRE